MHRGDVQHGDQPANHSAARDESVLVDSRDDAARVHPCALQQHGRIHRGELCHLSVCGKTRVSRLRTGVRCEALFPLRCDFSALVRHQPPRWTFHFDRRNLPAHRCFEFMTKLFNRWLPCATLSAWGAILLAFYFSGKIAHFLHPTFRPGVLIAGCAMLVLAASFAFLPGVAGCCDDENCGHPLGRMTFGRVLTFLILLIPIATAAMFSPKNFGATTIANRGVITDAQGLTARAPQA